jgi:hypothetical protein
MQCMYAPKGLPPAVRERLIDVLLAAGRSTIAPRSRRWSPASG